MNWNSLTVEQYQTLYPIITREDLTNLDRLVEIISVCEGLSIEEIDGWPFGKLMDKEKEYSFLYNMDFDKTAKRYIDCNGKRYKFVWEIQKMPAARYIEAKTYGQDVAGNVHRIMASCAMPMKKTLWWWQTTKYDAREHETYANDFKKAKFVDVYNCVVFFCQLLKDWIESSKDYLVSQMEQVMSKIQAETLLHSLWETMDGYTTLNKSLNTSVSV